MIRNNTDKPPALIITDQGNTTNQSMNAQQTIADTGEVIKNTAQITSKIKTEDAKNYDFTEEQIKKCEKMTVS